MWCPSYKGVHLERIDSTIKATGLVDGGVWNMFLEFNCKSRGTQ